MFRMLPFAALLIAALAFDAARGQSVDEQLAQARLALSKAEPDKAVPLLDKVIAADAKNLPAHVLRAAAHDMLRRHEAALADLNKVLELDPKLAKAYDDRGSVYFKLGKFRESLADFDKFLELRPAARNEHWRRGITCYYAGQFDEGRKQFEGYEKVDTNDVENAAWHFLCVARAQGVDKARAMLLKIGKDGRVPMMEVYALFAGKVQPKDVLAAAEAGNPPVELKNRQLFYAHLYLGLYYEVTGDSKRALEHMTQAADKYRIGHYMGDVAAVHRDVLKKAAKPE